MQDYPDWTADELMEQINAVLCLISNNQAVCVSILHGCEEVREAYQRVASQHFAETLAKAREITNLASEVD